MTVDHPGHLPAHAFPAGSAEPDCRSAVLAAVAHEQRWLGQELHDSLGQELTGLGLMADGLARRLRGTAPELDRLLDQLVAGLDRVRRQVQGLAAGLVTPPLDAPALRAALAELAARTADCHGVACTFEDAAPAAVAPAAAAHLLRIAQEAVLNALRHGRARHITIALRAGPDALVLSIRDDGAGLGAAPEAAPGLGARGMHDRAALLGGTLEIRPAEGGGTIVTCTLPGEGSP